MSFQFFELWTLNRIPQILPGTWPCIRHKIPFWPCTWTYAEWSRYNLLESSDHHLAGLPHLLQPLQHWPWSPAGALFATPSERICWPHETLAEVRELWEGFLQTCGPNKTYWTDSWIDWFDWFEMWMIQWSNYLIRTEYFTSSMAHACYPSVMSSSSDSSVRLLSDVWQLMAWALAMPLIPCPRPFVVLTMANSACERNPDGLAAKAFPKSWFGNLELNYTL